MFREEDWGHTPGSSGARPVFVQEEGEGGGGGGGRGEAGGAQREVRGKTTSYGLIEGTLLPPLPLPLHTGPGQHDARSLGRHRGEAQAHRGLRVTSGGEIIRSEIKFKQSYYIYHLLGVSVM